MSKTKVELVVHLTRQGGTTTKRIPVHDVDRVVRGAVTEGSVEAYARRVAAYRGWLGGDPVLAMSVTQEKSR